ncbi:hypothetical protein VPHK469_0027 [Vibrio phage K469]
MKAALIVLAQFNLNPNPPSLSWLGGFLFLKSFNKSLRSIARRV